MDINKRKASPRRFLCGLLALVLLIGALPALPALAEVTHGVVLGDSVLFRKSTSGSDFWDRLDRGWIAKVLDEVKAGNYTWYKVEANIPVSMDRVYTGYIRGDFFRMLTQDEETAWLVSKPQPYPALMGAGAVVTTASPAPGATATASPAAAATNPPAAVLTGDYGLVTVAGANLRQDPGGLSLTALQKDQLVKVLAFPSSGNPWYKVEAGSQTGYLQSDHLRVMSPTELAAYQVTAIPPAQVTPGASATLLPVTETATGTLSITKTSTNLRKDPGGTSLFQYPIGEVLSFYGAPVFSGGYYWARVIDSRRNLQGYIRSDCYQILTGSQETLPPATTPPTAGPSSASVRITLGGTNLRQTPGGTPVGVLARNRVLPFYGSPTSFGGYNWVYVYDELSRQYGYVRSDCYEFVTGAPQPVVTPSPSPAPGATLAPAAGTLTLTKGGVNLRNAPGGLTIAQLDRGTVMNYFSFVLQGGYTWYQVNSPKGPGWVRSDVIELNVPGPGATAAPTPVSTTPSSGMLGYVVTIKSEINLRKQAKADAQVLGRVNKSLVLPLIGPVVSSDGYSWFQVSVNGLTGYLRGDCVRQLNNTEIAAYLNNGVIPSLTPPAGNEPAPATGYVLTTVTSVNVRATASLDARTLGQIADTGTAFPLLGTLTAGGRLWYKITYQAQEGYLLGSVARMMTNAEYLAYIATQPTPAPTAAPTAMPPLSQMSDTAMTTIEKVIIRSGAGSTFTNLGLIYKRGSLVTLRGDTSVVGSDTWYSVRASGINGWIRGDLLRILTPEEKAALTSTGDPDAPKPATYRTLQLGSTGEDVLRLNQELNRLGYLQSAYVTQTYSSQTQDAVRAFQRANNLTVDGIAGSNTQHKMFGTVPEGTYTPGGGGTVTPTLYPVELVDWYTGDINAFWGRGETAIMTDVRTKISLRVKRWAGGFHMDGEPLTSADTAALCRIYGVSNAQQIAEQNLYQRRPVWITLKGRTFAASLYGVPHNYPDGDTIDGNEFNGQLCVHFYNSRVHTSGAVDRDHMRAIQYAYDNAPSRK